MKLKLIGLFVAVVVAIPVMTGTAGAAPVKAKSASPITLSCDNGHTYSAVTNTGNSDARTFSPAHDINSTSVLVPTSFGEFTGTLRNSANAVVSVETQPAVTKGNSQGAGSTPVHCAYTFTFSFTITGPGGDLPPDTYTFTGSGTANGFIPSHK